MDFDKDVIKMAKLCDDNFHVWKARIKLVLSLKELDSFIEEDPPASDSDDYQSWCRADNKAKAVIGLTLSDTHLEQVQYAHTAKQMWSMIIDIFEKHTLLNKLAARRRFYTVTMSDGEKVLEFASRVMQLAGTLKSMGTTVEDSEMAMALLNGLPDKFDGLISALDALGDDESTFTFEFVKSRCHQEEQRHSQRDADALVKSEAAALIAFRDNKCLHCGKNHPSDKCWKKYPHLSPFNKKNNQNKALVGTHQNIESDTNNVCLLNMHTEPIYREEHVCLAKYEENLPEGSREWFIDSACTAHMTYDRDAFTTYELTQGATVDLGADSRADIVGQGDVELRILVNGKSVRCTIRNVKHVPTLRYQLLSVIRMGRIGVRTIFDDQGAVLRKKTSNQVIALGSIVNNLYALNIDNAHLLREKAFVSNLSLWHQRLAHVNAAGIKKMVENGVVKGIVLNSRQTEIKCNGCILGKGHRTSIPRKSQSRASNVLDLVHTDVLGPFEVSSVGGSKYVITFIDDHSNWVVEYTMRHKSEALDRFKQYKQYAETHTNRKLKVLRSDNGGEYLSNKFKQYLLDNGIHHELTVAYTPQQNGVAERMNRTLTDLVRSMLYQKNMEKKFWAEALATAVYSRNRVTSHALPENITPFHIWHNKTPDLSHMRVFGSRCWYILPKKKVKKLDARSKEGIMMGYSKQSKGYKIWDENSKKFIVSRDIKCHEESGDAPERSSVEGEFDENDIIKLDIVDEKGATLPNNGDTQTSNSPELSSENSQDEATSELPEPQRRSSRQSKPPGEWWIAPSASPDEQQIDPETSLHASITDVPLSYEEATRPENIDFWSPGIKREEDSLRENKTFDLVERKPGMNVVPSRYVFKVKHGKPKARICAKGFRQVHGVDYTETFAPVVTIAAIRVLLSLAAILGLYVDIMDFITAFLNGDLEETIYMEVPAGFRDPNRPNLVCKLLKALYGLKQAPRQWYAKLHNFLVDVLGFQSCPYEPCLYVKHYGSSLLLIAVYVDDLLIASNDISSMKQVKLEFCKHFKMKDLGEAKEFLGLRITRDLTKGTISINQTEYIDSVLKRFGMVDAKPSATPMELPSKTSSLAESDDPPVQAPYRQAIGSLIWLMICTRPDIAYAVGKLSQHCENPLRSHWNAVKRVIRYLKGTRTTGLTYGTESSYDPIGYCDSDWAGCRVTRKSTEGFVILIGGGAVSWRSKKQSVIATSSCEAEYIASFTAAKECTWLSRLLAFMLRNNNIAPIILRVDNQGAIDTAKGTAINQRNKHIDIRYHYVREAVRNSLIKIEYCNGQMQIADPLTKPLLRVAHERLCCMMGLHVILS